VTNQPVEANVVLTADNTAYDQAMVQSAGSTNDLGKSIDSLGQKISNLSKSAGKKLLGVTAADTAAVTSFVAAWNSYEKQMVRLQSQSAILTRTQASQERVMKDYTSAVKGLRTEYGTTTTEAAKLVETLSKVTNIRQSRDLKDLSKVFVDMSHATGESSQGLASSLSNLQKVMGTPINAQNTRKYADMFTYLSAQTSSSAQSLIDFSAQLAPLGESMGMNTKQVAGFATAFARAGQEGIGASTVFTKIATDINEAVATGSPQMKEYANLVGVTAEQFKKMDSGEQMVRIFEALQERGKGAISVLQRMGLDGPRSMRAITAVLNEPGGVRQALGLAEQGQKSGAAAEGMAASLRPLNDEFDKMRENLKGTAESMARTFVPAVEMFMGAMVKASDVVRELAEGPMGKFLGLIMGIVAPLAGGAGAMLLFAGALMKVAAAFTLFRSSMGYGVREGLRGGAGMTRTPDGAYIARGTGMMGPRGAEIARDPRSSWAMRSMYNIGQMGGSGVSGAAGFIRSGWETGRSFADPNYRPDQTGRGPLSYAGGGVGRGLQSFVTPLFDQMRYQNAADRKIWLQNTSPLTRAADRLRLSGQMGAVAGEEGKLSSIRQEEARVRGDQTLNQQARQATLDGLKSAREETKERLNSARSAERVTRENINAQAAQRDLTRETRSTSTGFRRLGEGIRGYAGGVAGGLMGAGQAAMQNRQMAMMSTGMGVMAGAGAMGIQSNALMMGSMGLMFGSPVAAAGLGAVGAGIDMAKANDDLKAMNQNLAEGAKEAELTGLGLQQLDQDAVEASKALEERSKSYSSSKPFPMFTEPGEFFGAGAGKVKNLVEGIFGSSDIEELEGDQEKAQSSLKKTETVVRDLARAVNQPITGTRRNQLSQLEEFMSTEGARRLADAGVDLKDLIAASEEGGTAYADLIEKISAPGEASGLWSRMRAGGGIGAALVNDETSRRALKLEGDIALQYEAVDKIFTDALNKGKSLLQVQKEAEKAQQTIGVEGGPEYNLSMAIASRAIAGQQIAQSTMTRGQSFRSSLGQMQMLTAITPETAEQRAQIDTKKYEVAGGIADQANYFKQLLLAQEQYELSRTRSSQDFFQTQAYQQQDFDISRARSTEAFYLQQSYQQQDFAISRERAEENFHRMRVRASADFHRQERRATYAYNLQRSRAEEDFQHSVTIMAKQQAQSVYDIYQRVDTERTSSASWILSNANDQLQRMEDQAANLDKAREMGLSTSAIQQLGLTDPQNAQQLARLLTELTPQMIAQFNEVAGEAREKAAKDLITDPASLEWREMRRGFRQQMSRMAEDFERQMKESRKDFRRGLRQQQEDFNIMMEDQAEDFARMHRRQEKAFKLSMDQAAEDFARMTIRQEEQYKKSMDRAAEDMANMANEINLSLEEVLVTSVSKLSGSAKKQAEEVLKAFRDLKKKTSPEAIAIMSELAAIFGFEYKAPKSTSNNAGGGGGQHHGGQPTDPPGGADGAIIPGWTPGRDVTTARISGGEAIMRPEWVRAVGEQNINAMNHKAKYGGFADGGVYWPVPGRRVSTYPGHDGIDINRGSGSDDLGDPIRAFRSGTIAYAGSQHGYGNAIFENTSAGNVVYGHTSRMMVSSGQTVNAGQLIGLVGSSGNSTAPHLHFGIPGGTSAQALALLAGAIISGGGAGFGVPAGPAYDTARLKAVLKDRYEGAEAAAKGMKGVHPLFPGDISKVINRFARDKIKELRKKYKGTSAETGPGADIGDQPNEHMSNQDIVHTGANRMGWGDQWGPLYELVMHESGFNNLAQNPNSTAYGMFQFLDGTWAGVGGHKTSDPWLQTQYGLKYIKNRYDDPRGAWDFWQANNWYKDGAVFNGAQTIGVGENGPEAVIPLNARGGEFLADVMGSVMGGRNTQASGRGTNVYNTQVNRNTNFTGPITVMASDPMELMAKLQARARVRALSRPALTGSAA